VAVMKKSLARLPIHTSGKCVGRAPGVSQLGFEKKGESSVTLKLDF
jgi:hypothetical protein